MPTKLLLADDSITIQKVIGITFANEDFVITTVDNGDDALAKAEKVMPDIILADVVMPGLNGYEVCEAVKKNPKLANVPVLLLAGTFEAFDEERSRQVGADSFITKPFESQELIDKVKGLLAAAARKPKAAPAPASKPVATPKLPSVMSLADLEAVDAEPLGFDDLEPIEEVEPAPVSAGDLEMEPLEELQVEAVGEPVAPPQADQLATSADDLWGDTQAAVAEVLEQPVATGDDLWDAQPAPEPPAAPKPAAADKPRWASNTALASEDPFADFDAPAPAEPAPAPAPATAAAADDPFADFETAAPMEADQPPALDLGASTEEVEPGSFDLGAPDEVAMEIEAAAVEAVELEEIPAEAPAQEADEPPMVEAEPLMEAEPALDAAELEEISPEPPAEEPVAAEVEPSLDASFEQAPTPAPAPDDDDFDIFEKSAPAAPPVEVRPAVAAVAGAAQAIAAAAVPKVVAEAVAVANLDAANAEKVAWEVIPQLAEKIIRQIAWEVIPDLAEAIIKEEISKLKQGV